LRAVLEKEAIIDPGKKQGTRISGSGAEAK
jgi:hypothetical protein